MPFLYVNNETLFLRALVCVPVVVLICGRSHTVNRHHSQRTRDVHECFLIPSLPPTGWLHKEMKNSSKASLKLKKRWFLLTHNSLDYYKSSERNALKLGTLVLNSLCSVVQPDERVFKETGEERKAHGLDLPREGVIGVVQNVQEKL